MSAERSLRLFGWHLVGDDDRPICGASSFEVWKSLPSSTSNAFSGQGLSSGHRPPGCTRCQERAGGCTIGGIAWPAGLVARVPFPLLAGGIPTPIAPPDHLLEGPMLDATRLESGGPHDVNDTNFHLRVEVWHGVVDGRWWRVEGSRGRTLCGGPAGSTLEGISPWAALHGRFAQRYGHTHGLCTWCADAFTCVGAMRWHGTADDSLSPQPFSVGESPEAAVLRSATTRRPLLVATAAPHGEHTARAITQLDPSQGATTVMDGREARTGCSRGETHLNAWGACTRCLEGQELGARYVPFWRHIAPDIAVTRLVNRGTVPVEAFADKRFPHPLMAGTVALQQQPWEGLAQEDVIELALVQVGAGQRLHLRAEARHGGGIVARAAGARTLCGKTPTGPPPAADGVPPMCRPCTWARQHRCSTTAVSIGGVHPSIDLEMAVGLAFAAGAAPPDGVGRRDRDGP